MAWRDPEYDAEGETQVYDPSYHGHEDQWFDAAEPEPSSPPYLMVVLCSALLSATTVIALFLLMDNLSGGGKLSVPALVGLNPAQAGATAKKIGLVLAMAGEVQDPVIERGMVARQLPLAGTQTRPGQIVTITLSRGADQVTVKAAAGLMLGQARARLQAQGLISGGVQHRSHPSFASGQVISTNPPAGSTVSHGSRISLLVSSGASKTAQESAPAAAAPPPPVANPSAKRPAPSSGGVPKVTGIRLKFAAPRLRSRGLSVGRITYRSDEDHMEGYVLSQSPAAGAPLVKGDQVSLVVNRVD